jgi:hypothetical protein
VEDEEEEAEEEEEQRRYGRSDTNLLVVGVCALVQTCVLPPPFR